MGAHDHLSPLEFDKLRPESQKSVMQYIEEGEVDDVSTHLQQFDFIERDEPLEDLKRDVMSSPDAREFAGSDDFDVYHQEYVKMGDVPQHTERWPSIRAFPPGQGSFEDGWHRFHSYVAQGDQTIPTVEMREKRQRRR